MRGKFEYRNKSFFLSGAFKVQITYIGSWTGNIEGVITNPLKITNTDILRMDLYAIQFLPVLQWLNKYREVFKATPNKG